MIREKIIHLLGSMNDEKILELIYWFINKKLAE